MKRVLAWICLLGSAGALAADVTVTVEGDRLGARVNALVYPVALQKELTSGLTNRLYAQVSLNDASKTLAQKVVELAIRYDLWDEKFSIATSVDGTSVGTREFATLPEVNAWLAELPLPGLFEIPALPAGNQLRLRVQVLLNPIDREKMRMIRKWVAQNSTPESGGDQGISVTNAIFNRIFEQYADGSNVAAAWREDVSSAAFRVDQLKNEGR
jgi:hypothetical protein